MKKLILFTFMSISLACSNKEGKRLANLGETQNDTLEILQKGKNLMQLMKILDKYINERNNIIVKKLDNNYFENLVSKHPPTIKNIDTLYHIGYSLAFLDNKFDQKEYMFNLLNLEQRKRFNFPKNPFEKMDNTTSNLLRILKFNKKDSLLIKYYLPEEMLGNIILNDHNPYQNAYLYDSILNILSNPPLNFNYESSRKMVDQLLNKQKYINQWQGKYGFGFGGVHMGEEYEGGMSIVVSPDSSYINYYRETKNLETGKVIASIEEKNILAKVIRTEQDTLELQSIEDKELYILYRINTDPWYAIRGHAVYMLSPPNNDYPLTKKD